jgi:hypothetical protein
MFLTKVMIDGKLWRCDGFQRRFVPAKFLENRALVYGEPSHDSVPTQYHVPTNFLENRALVRGEPSRDSVCLHGITFLPSFMRIGQWFMGSRSVIMCGYTVSRILRLISGIVIEFE